MTVARLVCRLPAPGSGFSCPAGGLVLPWDARRDAEALAELATVTAGSWPGRGAPSAPGLAGEFSTRPGRLVDAWVAREAVLGVPVDPLQGVVSLVTATSAAGIRFSIGWLLVRPDCRRRGIGRALVSTAVAHARGQGSQAVWVETLPTWPEAAAFWRTMGFEPG